MWLVEQLQRPQDSWKKNEARIALTTEWVWPKRRSAEALKGRKSLQ
jgi:hypothetical protein